MSRVIEPTGAEADAWAGTAARASVWTPTRESASTMAFMSTLRLHSTAWHWVDAPGQARWWVIDAGAYDDPTALTALTDDYDRMPWKPHVAFLAAQLSQLPRPSWTFFKPPVKSGLVFNWIRPHGGQDAFGVSARPHAATVPAGEAPPWRQGLLRLRRWPNMSRYGNTLELTVACSRLLAAPASYEQLLQGAVPAPLLDRLLADAHEAGMLQLEPLVHGKAAATPAARAPAPESIPGPTPERSIAPPAELPAGERSRWDLVKRLLGKFARR
ncbi:MAG TPA: hypothetical protein PKO45_04930 [Rubrivivax sp.]|nr:hypothetical protein [Rubrivivax sp.]